MYLPIRPIKGQQFQLNMNTWCSQTLTTGNSPGFSLLAFSISKDGGSFNSLTNTPTDISSGNGYVVLTATEMTADVVVVRMVYASGTPRFFEHFILYTQPSELSAAPSLNDNLETKLTAIWQYLFNKRTVTATQEKLYKVDGTTVLATGTISDDGTTFTKGQGS